MTGKLTLQSGVTTDSATAGALNLNNSNIYGVNAIYTADAADGASEGFHFFRDSSHSDTIWVNSGNIYFVPNRAYGTNTNAANSQKVLTSGNYTSYAWARPSTITADQVILSSGTSGSTQLRGVLNNTAKGALGWNSSGGATHADNLRFATINTLAYWNGAFNGTSSNLSVLGTVTTGTWNATAIGAAYGGTGKTSLKDSANALINALDTGSSNLTANDYVITQYVGGGTTTTTYHRRPASAIRVGGLLTARKLKVALGSTTDATFDGTADQTSIPISGTLGVAHGGTGVTTAGANKVFAGPTTGDAVAPSFRSLDATDIPALAASKITSGTFDAARIPNLNWSKITAGKPTTLAGYGITDTIVKGNGRVFYGTCETAAGTVAKVVSCPSYDALTAGDILIVDFTVTNTGSVGSLTLNVNSTGAVSIKKQVNTSLSNLSHANELHKDTTSMFVYNGTYWVFMNGDYNSTYTVTDVWSNTAAATAAKVSSNSNYYVLREDAWFEFTLRYGNTASGALTLNVNSTGAKPIYINGTASSASNHTLPAGKYLVYYDGTNYYFRTDDKITANITGSAGSVAWSNVTGKPTTISGYGITDAKIASGTITLGSNTITPVTSVNGHTGSSVSVTATDLGLGNAMHFVGTTTTAMSDGLTTANVTVNSATHTPAAGDLVLHDNREYVWTGSLWEKLGIDGSLQETVGKVLGVSYDASTTTLYITCTENSTDVNAGTITDREYSI